MALSGSFRQTFNNNGLHDLIIEWSAKQNIAGNYSDVTAILYLKGNHWDSTVYSGSVGKPASITINGKKSRIEYPRVDIKGYEKRRLMTYTARVNHDSNGNGKFTITGTLDIRITWNGRWEPTYQMSTKTFSLNPIQRASTLSISTPSINYGDKLKFTINSSNGNFRHIVKLDVAGFSGNMMENQTAGYKEFQTNRNWMSALSSSTSTTGRITLDTYSGNSRIGRNTYTVKFNVPSDVSPTLNNVGHSELNSTVYNVLGRSSGKYVQGLSRIEFDVSAVGGYSSSISSKSISVNGVTVNGNVFDLANYKSFSGSLSYEVRVVDTRGRQSTSRGTLDVLPYSPPRITSFSVSRTGNGDIFVKRSGSVSSLYVGGYDKNSMTARIYIKEYGSSNWREYGSSTSSFNNITLTNIDKTKSYSVKTSISDRFLTVESTNTVSTEKALLNLHGNEGVGIGKMHEKGVLDIEGDTYINGKTFGRRAYFVDGFEAYEIKNGQDLNMFNRACSLRCSSYVATALRNSPTSKAFSLTVTEVGDMNGAVNQLLIENVSENPKMYMRSYNGSSWGDWECIYGRWVVSIPARSGFKPYNVGTMNEPRAFRNGALVTLCGAFSNTSVVKANGGGIMGILPVGFRPPSELNVRAQGSGAATFLLTIKPNGEIHCSRYSSDGSYRDISAGYWLNIAFTFIADKGVPI